MNCSLPGSSVHRDSPGKNTGVGCHFLLQGIFLTQESNPGLLHCRQILCQLSYKGSPLASIQFSSAQMFSITTEYLVQHFYFHLSVSPNLNCFSCKPSEVRSWFLFLLIQSDYLGFLIRVFVPFKCNVIVDMTGLSLSLCNTFLLPPFLFLPSLFTFLLGEV